jgi:SNF2 family DNA or RNA helicase
MKLCNHPSLVAEEDQANGAKQQGKRRAAMKQVKYNDGDENNFAAPGADGISKFLPFSGGGGGRNAGPVHPEWSGKMFVLYRLMKEMRKPGNGGDKIVIISNYTQTLDLIGRMCRDNSWGFCRLDGSVTMKKRQKMVDEFNDPSSSLVAFLLSSKAGGCGLNLIGGNRLVLFDPDWYVDVVTLKRHFSPTSFVMLTPFSRLQEPCSGQAGRCSMLARRAKETMLYVSFSCHGNGRREDLSTSTLKGRFAICC